MQATVSTALGGLFDDCWRVGTKDELKHSCDILATDKQSITIDFLSLG